MDSIDDGSELDQVPAWIIGTGLSAYWYVNDNEDNGINGGDFNSV